MKLLITLLLIFTVSALAAQDLKTAFDTTHYGRNDKVGKYLETRGFKIYYETYGSGEPLLIIHGNGGSIKDFMFQIPYFAKKYKVILADSRDQGKSADPKDSLSYEMITDDLNALLDNLHLKQCNVIGWSDGGIEGLLLAIRHPDKVKKLAVTGANLWPDTSAVDPAVYNIAIAQNKMVDDSLRKMKVPSANLKHAHKLLHLLSYEPHITTQQLSTIQCPTLVIGGDHDILLPKHTMLIAQSIPQSYLWIIPNSGHSTPIYYKDEFNKTVGDFFEKPYRKIEGTDRFN